MKRKQQAAEKIAVPAAGEGKRGVNGHLGYLLRQANAASRQRLEAAFADLGITQPQFAVLTMLRAYPGISGADLARLALLTPQTMNGIVRNLERARTIVRTADPVHGRVLRLDLTAHGEKILETCKARAHRLEAAMAAGLTAEEERVVRRWLVSLAAE